MRQLFTLPILAIMGFSQITLAGEIDFNRDIRPLLSDRCFACHGPDAKHRKGKLRLDEEAAAKDPKRGIIIAGKPEDSEFVYRITTDDPDDIMPPPDLGKPLNSDQKELLAKWIAEGANWSPHWAYVKPVKHTPPKAPHGWGESWIDAFAESYFRKVNLKPAIDAEPVTLLRRLHFDLTGLPPEPAIVDSSLSKPSSDAYSKIVDDLLDSPHYGEHMAAYWLDLVRFADTVGYHGDQTHNISPYRDWVIDAFNDDLPFDQFTREQLAGDLLPNATTDQLVATGYNRLLQTSHEGGVQAAEYIAMYAADRVRNVSAVWMGATVGCAQCHDHKYDPYTAEDFYTLSAFFADIDDTAHLKNGTNSLPTRREPEISVHSRLERQRIIELETRIKELSAKGESAETKSLQAELTSMKKAVRKTMITRATKPRVTRILPRGDWLDTSGAVVQPAVPEFLGDLGGEGRQNRLDLANWLTDAKIGSGALTARVLVNRLWYRLFGEGLAKDLADFGGQGQPPDHPELLDTLAVRLIELDWKIKPLLREILLSRTYRQTSSPSKGHGTFQTAQRLPAEAVRDNALAVSGILTRDIGGASVKPHQPAGYYRHLNFPTRRYKADSGKALWRRGLYVHWQRQFLHPMMRAFDAPRREECTAKRPRSNTPLASLVLLNDPTFVEAAHAFAKRILSEGGTKVDKRLQYAFHRAVSRKPDRHELHTLNDFIEKEGGQDSEDAWFQLARVLLNLSEAYTRR